jgi:FkbM family methyltransferase
METAMALTAALKSDGSTIVGESPDADPGTRLIQAGASILRLSNGVTLAVPPSLRAITTYVLLEQETWFEKELAFLPHVLKPGMTVIDIGANLGVYSLAMARLVAPGRVFAYEPASEPRGLLERSRALNQASNLEISAAAMSDGRREGLLAPGVSSELSALAESGPGERVQITSLDSEEAERNWPAPDFVKIDAEGEEERILAGGTNFLARHSPLVMFEIKAGNVINESLLSIFPAMGYSLYRSLPGMPVLLPVDPDGPFVDIELNLFAAKPDRARALAQAGLLVEAVPDWEPDAEARADFLALWNAQAYAPIFRPLLQDVAALDPDYKDGLAAYATWRAVEKPLSERCAGLLYAFRTMRASCQRAATSSRLSSFARIAWEAGERVACVDALRALIGGLQRGSVQILEPFWPACPRFDTVAADGCAGEWFLTSVVEQFERTSGFSSLFSGGSQGLEWLCQQPLASIEMERRRVLLAAGAGQRVEVPPRLCTPASDHLNAEIWRTGKVPGTSLGIGALAAGLAAAFP